MGNWKDILMARHLGQSVSKTAGLVGCLLYVIQYLPEVVQGNKIGELVTGSWGPRLIGSFVFQFETKKSKKRFRSPNTHTVY